MDNKEYRTSSPYHVLQQISEEAARVAGEALQGVYSRSNSSSNLTGPPRHRRSQSEVVTGLHGRSNSFDRFKSQMQRAWRWGGFSRENGYRCSFNPEVSTNQKRQWYQLHSKTADHTKYEEPTSLFEHFIVVGLHPEANLVKEEDVLARKKKWESEMAKSETLDLSMLQYPGPSIPTLEPQILFKYPPGKKLAMRPKDLAAFCFPGCVQACLLERTPSLSDLNELVYGQEHLARDDSSFIFSLKATWYSSIIAQERLNWITEFVTELSLADIVLSTPKPVDPINDSDSPDRACFNDWTASAIPVDNAVALTAATTGIISNDEVTSSSLSETRSPEIVTAKISETRSPEIVTASEASDTSQLGEINKDDRKSLQYSDECASEASENRSDNLERMCATNESGQASPDVGTFSRSKTRTIERLASSESLFSPARSMPSEEEDDEFLSSYENDLGDDLIMEWARENKNDLLQIVCGYHALPIPPRGSAIVFLPLKHLQAIKYNRSPVCALGICEKSLDSFKAAEVDAKLAAAEEALTLSIWTTATICRVLSIESVLALVSGVLLEKQVVVVCPNLGVLSAVVLSLIPMIRPFQWQSLLLPVLPAKMVDFLEAPVPFIVGAQKKPADLKIKTSNLVEVNVLNDQAKASHLPALPQQRELVSELTLIHARLSSESSIATRHPVYRCSELQAEAAVQFLNVMGSYMESLCSDLGSHTITNVQSNKERVSLLLKDSFVDSFPCRDRPFVKPFADTQLFSVLSDSRLSNFENGYF